ncbi:hypothetical protein GBF38_016667 [Scomber scombrus]|uniref:Uncharacterized protein n=1 Tax=Scomber scombrus TaxID=13677 RepID=A0AAV1PRU5_SCOSC
MRTLLLASALIAGLFGSLTAVPARAPSPPPQHASCKTLWGFAKPCAEVSTTLIQQIEAYNPLNGCEECQYTLEFAAPMFIKASHTSPDGLQAERIIFRFTPNATSGCRLFAQSTSLRFTNLIDNYLNYCNLYNLLTGLFGSPAASPVPVPYHAFCRTLWLFGLPCTDVGNRLVHQIQAFSPLNGCKKCHYIIVSATNTSIQAHHTSPDNLHVESLEFTLQTTILTGSCRVNAQSASLTFSSLLDGGLNYCNLYDLLTASGLNLSPGFLEMTSEWACLGYTTATCRT